MWLRRVTHSGAYNLVEHPYRDLAIVALVVIIHLTAKHALRSGLAAADNDISSGQRMPPILHPPDIRLVIILIGTCTTRSGCTRPSTTRHQQSSSAPHESRNRQRFSLFHELVLETRPLAGPRIDDRHPTLGSATPRSTIDTRSTTCQSPPAPPSTALSTSRGHQRRRDFNEPRLRRRYEITSINLSTESDQAYSRENSVAEQSSSGAARSSALHVRRPRHLIMRKASKSRRHLERREMSGVCTSAAGVIGNRYSRPSTATSPSSDKRTNVRIPSSRRSRRVRR